VPASATRPQLSSGQASRLWWLPLRGKTNGLTDAGWAPVADIPASIVPAVLTELGTHGVPGFAAPLPVRPRRRTAAAARPDRWRLWAGTSRYSQAEEVLRIALPRLLPRARA